MRRTLFVAAALAGSICGAAHADPIVTKGQVVSTAGAAAGSVAGGPVGGALGGLVGRVIGAAIDKDKPNELGPIQAPAAPGPVAPIAPQKPLEVARIKTDPEDTIKVEAPPPEAVAAPVETAQSAVSSAQPASGTLDAQLDQVLSESPAPQ